MPKSRLLFGLIVLLHLSGTVYCANILLKCDFYNRKTPLNVSLTCLRFRSLEMVDELVTSPVISVFGDSIKLVKRNNLIRSKPRELENKSWSGHVMNKLGELFETHVLQIDLNNSSLSARQNNGTGRGRRRQMMPMMLFGIVAIAMILVPIGFQALTLMAGKAILFSAIALVLTSISGFKRIANGPPVVPPPFRSQPEPPLMEMLERGDSNYYSRRS